MTSFSDYLQDKLGSHEQGEIQELILDEFLKIGELTEDHQKTLEEYKALIHLTLNHVGLKTLKNFPKLEKLQIIELNKNNLTGDDLKILVTQCPELYKIKLEDNQIESVDKLKQLFGLPLKKLNLKGNPLTEKNGRYSEEIFKMFKDLESVDDLDKDGNEVDSTIYGGEGEEEDDDAEDFDDDGGEDEDDEGDDDDDEGEEFDDGGDEDDEDDEGDDDEGDDDDEDDEAPNKKAKH